MHGERRGIHVIQHNTNEPKTGEKPGYVPSGLAFSTGVYHRNNRKAQYGHGARMHAAFSTDHDTCMAWDAWLMARQFWTGNTM